MGVLFAATPLPEELAGDSGAAAAAVTEKEGGSTGGRAPIMVSRGRELSDAVAASRHGNQTRW